LRQVPGLGPEYLYVKTVVAKAQSVEDDIRAVLAQYTEDETTIKLFQATKLTRFLPAGEEFTNPSQVERAAYRLFVEGLSAVMNSLPEQAVALYKPYALIPIIRDVELIVRRAQRGEKIPGRDELFWPENKLVQEALRLAEEGINDPVQVLRRLGLSIAYDVLVAARSTEALSTALDIELMKAFSDALDAAETELGRELIGGRLDILAAKTMYSLIEMKPARQVIDTYLKYLAAYKLSSREIRNAVESLDEEQAKRLLTSSWYGNLSENLGILEGFIAKVRKHLRPIAKKIFAWEPVMNDPVVGLAELLLLDAEDSVIIALLAYSRQPKQRVIDLVSL